MSRLGRITLGRVVMFDEGIDVPVTTHPPTHPAASPSCRLTAQGLIEALVGLCFNEIASFVHGCQHYLRQRQEMEGGSISLADNVAAAAMTRSGGNGRSASVVSVGGASVASGGGGRRRRDADPRFTEVRIFPRFFRLHVFIFSFSDVLEVCLRVGDVAPVSHSLARGVH